MTTFAKITLTAYLAIFCFCLGKFTYADGDGFGFFIPHVGGYHVSTLN
jgi:hypothetical protein